MIIDLILDRKDGEPYNPKDFYTNVLAYEDVFKFEPTISKAMDYGEEEDVKRALCDYINRQNYNPSICDYINSVNWLTSSRKPIKSAVSDDKWELVDELCNRAIAEMNGDRDAMFFTRMSNGFIVKGKYIDEYESSTGITNPHKLWKKIVMVLGMDELVPITEGTFRKYYELGVKWVGMEIQNSRKSINSSLDLTESEILQKIGNAKSELNDVAISLYFSNERDFHSEINNIMDKIDEFREKYIHRPSITNSHRTIKSSADNLPSEVYYIVVNGSRQYYSNYDEADDNLETLRAIGKGKVDGVYTETDPDEIYELYEVGYIGNSRKVIKSAKTLKDALAGLNDIEDEFALVNYVEKILKDNGMSDKFEAFCDETDEADTPEELGDVAEKYIRMAIKSSHKPVKSSTTWVAGKSENGNKSFYCEDGKFYAEEDYGRPSIKVFNNKDDAEKIAKRSKSGFIQVLDEYDD